MYRAHSLLLSWRNSLSGSEHHQQLLSTVLLWCVFVFEKEKKKKYPKQNNSTAFPFSLCVCSKPKLLCFAVCDVNLCPESSVSCAAGLSLVQTHVPGLCCPQYHCGTHTHTHINRHLSVNYLQFLMFYYFI